MSRARALARARGGMRRGPPTRPRPVSRRRARCCTANSPVSNDGRGWSPRPTRIWRERSNWIRATGRRTILLAEVREETGDYDGAIASYEAALRLEPSTDVETRVARARERADLARLPEEFQALSTRPEATRADSPQRWRFGSRDCWPEPPPRRRPSSPTWARTGPVRGYWRRFGRGPGGVSESHLSARRPCVACRPGASLGAHSDCWPHKAIGGRSRGSIQRRSSPTCRRPTPPIGGGSGHCGRRLVAGQRRVWSNAPGVGPGTARRRVASPASGRPAGRP